jgi:hypothetical protein
MIKLSNDNPDNNPDNNPDIRKEVDASRGFQKKLELLIPGLRGYRTREDLRVSDDLLRNQVADRLNQTKGNLEGVRKQMVTAGDFTNLTSIGSLISQVQQLSGQIRHAQQGYSGFVATISINEDRLNKLYEYDYNFVSAAIQLQQMTSPSTLTFDASAPASIQTEVTKISEALADVKQKWSERMAAVENILVK